MVYNQTLWWPSSIKDLHIIHTLPQQTNSLQFKVSEDNMDSSGWGDVDSPGAHHLAWVLIGPVGWLELPFLTCEVPTATNSSWRCTDKGGPKYGNEKMWCYFGCSEWLFYGVSGLFKWNACMINITLTLVLANTIDHNPNLKHNMYLMEWQYSLRGKRSVLFFHSLSMSAGSTAFHSALNPASTILSLEEKLIVSVSPAVTRSLGGDVLQWVPEKKSRIHSILYPYSQNTAAAHMRAN